MPQPYRQEVRDGFFVQVVMDRDKNTTIATEHGAHEGTINKWIRPAEIDVGNKPGNTSDESAELREPRRRTLLLEQRTSSCATQPLTWRRQSC